MSSFTELQFAVDGKDAHHVPFDLETVMRTGYEIDKFQRAYFVLPSFDALARCLPDRRFRGDRRAPQGPAGARPGDGLSGVSGASLGLQPRQLVALQVECACDEAQYGGEFRIAEGGDHFSPSRAMAP